MRAVSRVGVGFVLASLIIAAPAGPALAQEGTLAPSARCLLPPAGLDDEAVSAFMADPAALTREFPGGGLLMEGRVRALAGSRAEAVQPLITLAKEASEAQKRAIGAGLARAAAACVGSNPDYAALIQEELAALEDEVLFAAFVQTSDEVMAAALAPAAAGAPAAPAAAPAISGSGAPGTASATRDGTEAVPAGEEDYAIAGHDPYLFDGDRDDASVSPTRP